MTGFVRTADGRWCAFGYSNAATGQRPDLALPVAATMADALARELGTLVGHGQAPDEVLWAVNPSIRERAQHDVPRYVHRLVTGSGRFAWEPAQEDEPRLRAWEAELLDRERQPQREQEAREDAAVAADGFFARAADGGILCRLLELERATGVPSLWLFVPREVDVRGAFVLRPWNLWIHPDHAWRADRDAALTPALRKNVIERAAAWLLAQGHATEVVTALPDAARPMHLRRVTVSLADTLLAFLRALGMARPADARHEWHMNQGGERNARVCGPIPVARVRAAFVLPTDPHGAGNVEVAADKIEAGGGDTWVATIWSAPDEATR